MSLVSFLPRDCSNSGRSQGVHLRWRLKLPNICKITGFSEELLRIFEELRIY